MNSLIAAINHAKTYRVDGIYHLEVRTHEMRDFLLERAKLKGMSVEITVKPPPHYFKSSQDHLDYLLKTNELFTELVTSLGLKLK